MQIDTMDPTKETATKEENVTTTWMETGAILECPIADCRKVMEAETPMDFLPYHVALDGQACPYEGTGLFVDWTS